MTINKKRKRMKKDKNGYVRTLEAFLAFFLTFLFVVFVVLKGVEQKPERPHLEILETLEQQEGFRDCVHMENITCMKGEIDDFVPNTYNYDISINSPEPPSGQGNIFTETLFMTGNQTNDYKVIYLYYWVVG